jgi:hypothetical protein
MATSSDPLLTAAKRWQRRIAIGTGAGYNPAAIQAVQHADLAKVGMGGSGLSDQEALAAIQSAATGKTSQQKQPSSSIMGIPGRMVSDVGKMLGGLATGAMHVAEHPVRDIKGVPRGIGETLHELPAMGAVSPAGGLAAMAGVHGPSSEWQQAHGYEGGTGLGSQIRNLSKTPVGKFFPGTMTAANVTTPAGRKEILQHPGFTAADLIPYGVTTVKTLAYLGAFGAETRVAAMGLPAAPDLVPRGSVGEAALEGHVAKVMVRSAAEGLQRLTGGRYGLGLPTLDKLLTEYGATRLTSQVIGKIHDWTKNLSPADRQVGFDLLIRDHPTFAAQAEEAGAFPAEHPGAAEHARWARDSPATKAAMESSGRAYERMAAAHSAWRPGEPVPEVPPAVPAAGPGGGGGEAFAPGVFPSVDPRYGGLQPHRSGGPVWPETATFHDVSQWAKRGIEMPDGTRMPIEFNRATDTADEGWYIRPKGTDAPEILVRRTPGSKGYVEPGPPAEARAAEPGPRARRAAAEAADPARARARMDAQLERAHVASRTAAQAWAEHLANEPPRPPVEALQGQLSPAQESMRRVWFSRDPAEPAAGPALAETKTGAMDPALLRMLPLDQQYVLLQAQRQYGQLLAFADQVRMGTVQTATDLEGEALRLDPSLRAARFSDAVHFDLFDEVGLGRLRDNPRLLEQIPDLANPNLDLAAGWTTPRDVYNGLFGQKGEYYTDAAGVKRQYRVQGVLRSRIEPGPLAAASQRFLMGPFRASIWARPMMVANMAVRSLIMAVGQEGVEVLKPSTLVRAFQMVREGDPTVAAGFRNLSTDQVHSLLGSATLGRILDTIPGGVRRVSNLLASTQRAAVFLTEHDNMVAAGASEETARMAGMQAIRDALVTHDTLTPIEQSIVRQVFPFYAYQKMLFGYLANYPADHPFVTEVASKIGRQETELNSSGLPQMLQQMFQLGSPDQSGNVRAIDVRGFNPFRNFANDMTLTGMAMNANPALKILMEGFGVNPAKGTPELYPGLTYNPQTGSLEATRPSLGPLQMAESVIPQLGTIDAMLGFNSRLKYLKQTNPSAYRAMLFQTLGIPIPQTVNVPAETAHAEESLYRLSQTAVSNFLKTGDSGFITGYNLLPWSSRWWTPDQLEQAYNAQATRIRAANQAPAGSSLKALLTPLPRRTAQLPPTGS